MARPYSITVASPPDREHLVAEVFFGDTQLCELNIEQGALRVEIYPPRGGGPWNLDYNQLISALVQAREHLGV